MSEEERWEKWLGTPFKCGHPNTRENIWAKINTTGYWQRVCLVCKKAQEKRSTARRAMGLTPAGRGELERGERPSERDNAIQALGRCPICLLWRPCHSKHSAVELAGNRRSITMPEGG